MSKKEGKSTVSMVKIGKDYISAKKRYRPLKPEDEENIEGKIVVITGGNSGLGEVVVMELAKRRAIIVMCCRDIEKAKKSMEAMKQKIPKAKLDLIPLDLGDLESVRKCGREIKEKYDHINLLINNAGVLYRDDKLHKTKDGFEAHMGINHLGNFLFTLLLLDLVKASANQLPNNRIVFVGSTAHLFAELDMNDLNLEKRGKSFGESNQGPYGNSKLANMYFARELTKRLDGTGILVSVLCPGFIKTDIFRNDTWLEKMKSHLMIFFYGSSLADGADTILHCSLSTRIRTGQMHRFNHVWPGAMDVLDDLIAKQLWDMSESLVGIKHY